MKLHCNNCGQGIRPLCNFCPFCGTEAPRKTIAINLKEQKIKKGIYCPDCKELNLKEALYCSDCGINIYKRPVEKSLYCLQCGEKNSVNAKHCCNCGLLLDDWFEMRGEIGERLGHSGNLQLYETMTGTTYQFFTQARVTVGRHPQNDIVMPSDWVSFRHCVFDLEKMKLEDLDSSNGIFVNRKPDRIKSLAFSQIHELNIAGALTFSVLKPGGFFAMRLTAILADNHEINMAVDESDRLRQRYFIFVLGDGEIMIRKMDGKIATEREPSQDYYYIKTYQGKYYFSDFNNEVDNQLILKNAANIEINWKIEK